MPSLISTLIITDRAASGEQVKTLLMSENSDYLFDIKVISSERALEIVGSPQIIFIINSLSSGIGRVRDMLDILTEHFPESIAVSLLEGGHVKEARLSLIDTDVDEIFDFQAFKGEMAYRLIVRLLDLRRALTTETMLQESEERFRGIIEYAHDIVLLLDEEATIVYASPAFERQRGYAPWETLGQALFSFIHQDDVEQVRRHFHDLTGGSAEESAGAISFRFRHKKGHWLYISTVATNQLANPAVGAVVFNSRDVTEAKAAEAEIEKYQQHLEALVEKRTREAEEANIRAASVLSASPVSLLALDYQGIITFVSRHYHQVYPQSAALLTAGRQIMDAFDSVAVEMGITSDDVRYQALKEWWRDPKGGMELKLDNGHWLFLQARKMSNDRGIVILTTNITDHKKQEALMAQSLEQERKALEQQRRFVSMVSHEFRTPLTIIDGSAQIIQNRGSTLDAQTLAKRSGTIRESVGRLVSLIEDVLSANVLESGNMHLQPEPCDFKKLLRDIAEEQEEISGKHKVELNIESLPDEAIVDAKIMRHIFGNLINNAIKYSPAAKNIVVSGIADMAGKQKSMTVSISDSGVGIPADELPRIFDRFFRASTAGSIPGTGVGLSLVRELVELHRGTVEVSSETGKGTTIRVRLPIG